MPDQAACSRCGTPVPPGARHCPQCGADVSGQQGQVATAYVTPDDAARMAQGQSAQLDALRRATLGHYDIQGELGQGGMATVYLAHDIALDRKVAIKMMSPGLFSTAGMVERFKREARTAAALSHPHVIPIYAVREGPDLVYFVMKFVEGRSLESILRVAGALPLPLVRAVLYQVGEALGYAHRRGVIHRDVKPANVMLDEGGWVVVTDFGIAKVAETQGLTMTGATIGTPSYMSPEQCEAKRELTGASDQYSLGIVAYEMLSGRLPFLADTTIGLLYAQVHEPPTAIADLRPDCPPETAAALMRMLEKDPARRWPDVEAAVAALGGTPLAREDPVHGQLAALAKARADEEVRRVATPVSPLPATRGPKPKTTRSAVTARRRVSVVVWALPVVALAAGGVWWVVRRSTRQPPVTVAGPVAEVPHGAQPETAVSQFTRPEPAPLAPARQTTPTPPPRAITPAPGPVRRESIVAPPAAPAPQGPRPAIEAVAAELARALESRNLAEVRRVYPNMTVQQAQEWGGFFMGARNLRVTLRVTSLDVRDDQLEAGFEGSYDYEDMSTGRGVQRPVTYRGSFVRDGAGWRLTSLR
jgi:eukaryotic-like serine/threonine-protein kinase